MTVTKLSLSVPLFSVIAVIQTFRREGVVLTLQCIEHVLFCYQSGCRGANSVFKFPSPRGGDNRYVKFSTENSGFPCQKVAKTVNSAEGKAR